MPTAAQAEHRHRIAAAFCLAHAGGAAQALDQLGQLIGEVGPLPSYELAMAQHAISIAAFADGDAVSALRAADACLQIAEVIGDPGWVSCALAARVPAVATVDDAPSAMALLVRAESATRRCRDTALVAWARLALGDAYESLRLFELAVPHYEAVASEPACYGATDQAQLIAMIKLGWVHLVWTAELLLLVDPQRRTEISDNHTLTRSWAHRATRAAQVPMAPRAFLAMTQALVVCSDTNEDAGERVGRLVGLRGELRRLDLDLWAHSVTLALADTLLHSGQLDAAQHEIDCVLERLESMTGNKVERIARHVALLIADRRGDRGARAGLEYATTISRSWWHRRLGDLEAMPAALATYELAQTHERVRREAREDPLTGLSNRRGYDERLAALALLGRATLILIDVDNLKAVNDTRGHLAGDRTLRAAADLIRQNVRGGDLATRIGGDEFVILIDSGEREDAEHLLERLKVATSMLTADGSHLEATGLSFGVASTSEGIAVDDLMRVADIRMYEHKRASPLDRPRLSIHR